MQDIFQRLTEFMNYANAWFNQYVFSGLAGFLKALIELFIRILEFLIDILRWFAAHL